MIDEIIEIRHDWMASGRPLPRFIYLTGVEMRHLQGEIERAALREKDEKIKVREGCYIFGLQIVKISQKSPPPFDADRLTDLLFPEPPNEEDHLCMLRRIIEEAYNEKPTRCGGSFGEILCWEIHSNGMTFEWLAEKWGISLPTLGELIWDHCKRLEDLPHVRL